MSKTFAIVYTPGSGWLTGRPIFEQPLEQHWQYLHWLYQNGILIEGGPYTDDSGGIVLIRAGDLDEAWEVVEQDPAVASQIYTAEVHPWYQIDWANYGT